MEKKNKTETERKNLNVIDRELLLKDTKSPTEFICQKI